MVGKIVNKKDLFLNRNSSREHNMTCKSNSSYNDKFLLIDHPLQPRRMSFEPDRLLGQKQQS
jgi:hypothetical protein